ncbi:MAG: fused MFS/spermidine synthase [Psychroserpens sp.]|uniref:fused MFS/spermidine synthase n=1 Tax=Psychroserpens sp. TaxID=2020870 RepID=UPI003C733E9B
MQPTKKTFQSKFSGTLELIDDGCKKRLNSKNANYSYGALQTVLKFGLDQIDLAKVNSVLLLGLGGGSVIKTLRQDFKYQKSIIAVDIDPVIIDIAKTEFLLNEDKSLKIICQDAAQFLMLNSETFDLIIIDLFIDIQIPKVFLELKFWESVVASKSLNGIILFNASVEKKRVSAVQFVVEYLKTKVYNVEIYDNVNGTNTLVISQSL